MIFYKSDKHDKNDFRSKITVVNISLCFLIVVGNSLVAQPTFLFGQLYLSSSQQPSTYTLGIILALTAALITGFCPVLQANCKDVPIAYYMLGSGLAKLIIGDSFLKVELVLIFIVKFDCTSEFSVFG